MRNGSTRFIAGLTAAGFVLTSLSVAPFFGPASAGLPAVTVVSERFDTSATNWSPWLADSWVGRTTTGAKTAPGALAITARTGATVKWVLPGSLFTDGVTYTFSASAKLSSGTATMWGSVQAFNSRWVLVKSSPLTSTTLRSDSWNQVSATFTIPAGTTTVFINMGGPKVSWTLDDALITRPAAAVVTTAGFVTAQAVATTPPPATTAAPTTGAPVPVTAPFGPADVLGYGSVLRPFAANSPWNTPISSSAVYSGTLPWPTSPSGSWWINQSGPCSTAKVVGSTGDPLVTVITNYTGSTPFSPNGDPQNATRWGRQANTSISVRIPAGVNGAGQDATPGKCDGSLVVLDTSTGMSHDFWQFTRVDATHATASGYGSSSYTSGTGWGIASSAPAVWPGGLNAGTTATGANKFGGIVTQAQIDSGSIDHALALGCDLDRVGISTVVKPAIWGDHVQAANGFVHESDRLAIATDTPMPAQIKSDIGIKVWKALVNYGAYCVDYARGTTILSVDTSSVTAAEVNALVHSTPSTWGTVGSDEWPTMGVMLQKIVG